MSNMNFSSEVFEEAFALDDDIADNVILIDEDGSFNETSRIHFEIHEKVIFGLQWFLFQVIGNGLLIGIIQFDRFGADPLKRRITDQVS